MELRSTPRSETFRTEIRTFLTQHLPLGWPGFSALSAETAAEFTHHWRALLAAHGYLDSSSPKQGGDHRLSTVQKAIMAEEFARAGLPPNWDAAAVGPR